MTSYPFPAASPAPASATSVDPTAVMGRRIPAIVVDFLLYLLVISFVGPTPLSPLAEYYPLADGVDDSCQVVERVEDDVSGCVEVGDRVYFTTTSDVPVQAITWFAFLALYVALQGATGRTPGKALFGIKAVDERGEIPRFGKSLGRTLMWIVDAAPWCLPLVGFITGLTTTGHRRVGDMACKTFVVGKSHTGAVVVPGLASTSPYGTGPGAPGGPGVAGAWGPAPGGPPSGPPSGPPTWSGPAQAPTPWGAQPSGGFPPPGGARPAAPAGPPTAGPPTAPPGAAPGAARPGPPGGPATPPSPSPRPAPPGAAGAAGAAAAGAAAAGASAGRPAGGETPSDRPPTTPGDARRRLRRERRCRRRPGLDAVRGRCDRCAIWRRGPRQRRDRWSRTWRREHGRRPVRGRRLGRSSATGSPTRPSDRQRRRRHRPQLRHRPAASTAPAAGAPAGGAQPAASGYNPQWDAARGTYILWEPQRGQWLGWDEASRQWRPL